MTEPAPPASPSEPALQDGSEPAPLPAPDHPSAVDRASAFAAGPSKIPRNIIMIFVVCVAALGLGGALLDHFFPGPVGTSTTTTLAGSYPPPFQTGTSAGPGPGAVVGEAQLSQLPASSSALMGLQRLKPRLAPGFTLEDQHGRAVSLASFRGKVVVLSFFDAACDDICPVLETELSLAYADLGADSSRVALLTINTDPLFLAPGSAKPAAATGDAVTSSPSWYFLTGSVRALGPIWSSYGISIDVQRLTGSVSHNDLLYFIDPSGRLRLRATPFANESGAGSFSLPRSIESAWAAGIARQARALLGPAA